MFGMDANELQRQRCNTHRFGTILAVDHPSALCRVSIGAPDTDEGGLQTDWLPWLAPAAGATREWLPPSVGEQVMLICPMGDPAQAVVLHGLFSHAMPAPSRDPHTHTRVHPDGATIEYNYAAHALKAELPDGASVRIIAPGSVTVATGTATIQADTLTLDAKQTTCTGHLLVQGALAFESGMAGKSGNSGATMRIDGKAQFTGDVVAAGVSVSQHTHQARGEHAESITKILTTPIGSRLARRDFGSELPNLIDAPNHGATRVRLYAALATALMRWEPRLHLTRVQWASDAGTPADVQIIDIEGTALATDEPVFTRVPLSIGAMA
ncbi:hypothetical protein DFQ30_004182 [Apophysomyces sp. BC1015]|nr:hypothetical protein DFQ30_004182 [Apophysomyces sp. BC1015]